MKPKTLAAAIVATAFTLAAPLAHSADPAPAVTFTNLTGVATDPIPYTTGFKFEAVTAVTVLQLGAFDDSQDGLAQSHQVGLWDSSGNLMAAATIPAGTGGQLIDQFRYHDIFPVSLVAGQDYVVGEFITSSSPDNGVIHATGFVTDPRITFIGEAYKATGNIGEPGSFEFPNQTYFDSSVKAYFGANLILAPPAPVPEPATWTLLLVGVGGVGTLARRRRQQIRHAQA